MFVFAYVCVCVYVRKGPSKGSVNSKPHLSCAKLCVEHPGVNVILLIYFVAGGILTPVDTHTIMQKTFLLQKQIKAHTLKYPSIVHLLTRLYIDNFRTNTGNCQNTVNKQNTYASNRIMIASHQVW